MEFKSELGVFKHVVKHLARQNKQALDNPKLSTSCQYRTHDGLKCAVGAVLEDRECFADMEGNDIFQLIAEGWLPGRFDKYRAILASLQFVHDNYKPEQWQRMLKITAQLHKIKPEVVDKIYMEVRKEKKKAAKKLLAKHKKAA